MLRSMGKKGHTALAVTCRRSQLSSLVSKTEAASPFSTKSITSSSSSLMRYAVPVSLFSLAVGFAASFQTPEEKARIEQLPLGSGFGSGNHDGTTTSCETPALSSEHQKLVKTLRRIVGKKNVVDGQEETPSTATYPTGGTALAIVRPQKLRQVQEILQEVVDAGCVLLVQDSSTDPAGASNPRNPTDGRPAVILSMEEFDTVFPIDDGAKVVCLAGVSLASLQDLIQENFPDRESHASLDLTVLNQTTAAGVAYGSGGSQLRKGPAFTERALYLKVVADKYGKHIVKVVNTLGIEDLDSEEGEFVAHKGWDGVITKLDSYIDVVKNEGDNTMKSSNDTYGQLPCHDHTYKENVCLRDGNVARCNADTRGIDCNRSEGKVLILATVHDTFLSPERTKTYWLSFQDLDTAMKFKTEVCLNNPEDLPMSIEYMDRDSFDIIDQAGRFMGNLVKVFGSASPMVIAGWALKSKIEALDVAGAATFPDAVQYRANSFLPAVLPQDIMKMGRARDHHIVTTVGDFDGSMVRFEERLTRFRKEHQEKVDVHECQNNSETAGVIAFQFVAPAAFKTYCVGTGLQGFSVDYALPKNYSSLPQLPPESIQPVKRMRYSHFGCNVVHEGLAYEPGVDTHAAKMELKHIVDEVCQGSLPAQYGHGTDYHAPPEAQKRWMTMDPCNVMNPGVGGLSTRYCYAEE